MTADEETPQLTVRPRPRAGALAFSYHVVNSADRPLFLFNKLFEDASPGAQLAIQRNLCIIGVEEDLVIIAKKIFPVPEGTWVECLSIPCATEVPRGESFNEEIVLKTPLRRWNSYEGELAFRYLRALPVVFEVGYFYGSPGARDFAGTVRTNVGECLIFDAFPIESQRLLRSDPFAWAEILL